MFSLDVVDTDRFLELSTAAQCLYFHAGMVADDDGFLCASDEMIKRTGCGQKELDELADAGYIIRFESGVIAISDWNINNHVPKREYNQTRFQQERKRLSVVNGSYKLIQE
jgi:hypothetical protein